MSTHGQIGAVPLGSVKPMLPEYRTYVLASVDVIEGGDNIGDATHILAIELPAQGRELRIPMNAAALRELGRKASKAGGVAQPAIDQELENTK